MSALVAWAPATVAVTVTDVDVVMIVVLVVLLAVLGFLASAETSLTRMNRARAAALEESERRGSRRLAALTTNPERWLNALLLVVLVFQTAQTALTTIVAERLFGSIGVVVSLLVNVGVVFVLTEAAPKTWALQNLDRAALLSARPVAAVTRFPPVRWIATGLIGVANVLLPGKGLKQGPFVSEEELLALAEEAAEAEVIEPEEQALINSVITFGDTIVREVMVPRTDMVSVAADFRVGDAMEVVLLNGLSRIPVSGEGIDDIIGILYAKDIMRAERDHVEDRAVGEVARPAHFVPETKRVAELLREMQADKNHMSIVIDEYGGTAGLATLEDLIEELVGEIVDEFDVEDPMVEPLPGGDVRVNGRLAVHEANEVLDADLPEGEWDTVGGLLFTLLGHVAVEGETAEADGVVLRADRVQGRRINRIRISRLPVAEDGTGPLDESGWARAARGAGEAREGAPQPGPAQPAGPSQQLHSQRHRP